MDENTVRKKKDVAPQSVENGSDGEKKLKYPKSIIFIVSSEFCERFTYYGMRAILSLYLRNQLNYSDNDATMIYHSFVMLAYFFPLVGGILADSKFGRFRIIFYLSVIYSIGQLIIATGAITNVELPSREMTLLGLVFIAMGTGGIKPCVPTLGGDQFVLPQQEKYLALFFDIFYFSVHCGSLLSTFVTPELRTAIGCFGAQECYSAAFFLPAILMIIGTVIFVAGKPLYRLKNPERNIPWEVVQCIWHALGNRIKANKDVRREHWLDYADAQHDNKLITDVKAIFKQIKLLLPIPLFWALYEQQGSRWTFQGTRMNGEIGSYLIKPDQMHLFNSLMILVMIPLFSSCVYPILHKIKGFRKPLTKIISGGAMAALAFLVAAILEFRLETTYPVLPTAGEAQLRIFNPRDCYLPATINNQSIILEPFGIWSDTEMIINGEQSIPYTADFSQCSGKKNLSGFITAVEGQVTSCVLEPSSVYSYQDFINKTRTGKPAIRVLTFNTLGPNAATKIELLGSHYVFETTRSQLNTAQITPVAEFLPDKYSVEVNGKVVGEIAIKLGGVYTLQIHITEDSTKINLKTITPSNSIHILWQLPQYTILTMGEVLCAIPGLHFTFSQAPPSMKSLIMAFWLMCASVGNLIVIAITALDLFSRQSIEFLFFAGIGCIDMVFFFFMIRKYVYRYYDENGNLIDSNDKSLELKITEDTSCNPESTQL